MQSPELPIAPSIVPDVLITAALEFAKALPFDGRTSNSAQRPAISLIAAGAPSVMSPACCCARTSFRRKGVGLWGTDQYSTNWILPSLLNFTVYVVGFAAFLAVAHQRDAKTAGSDLHGDHLLWNF